MHQLSLLQQVVVQEGLELQASHSRRSTYDINIDSLSKVKLTLGFGEIVAPKFLLFLRLSLQYPVLFNYKMKDERSTQTTYWTQHASSTTIETMMLDSKAKELDQCERPEVLALQLLEPHMSLLELGAGIGRFTPWLAEKVSRVHTVDFIENLIMENKKKHEFIGNITFEHADLTKMNIEADLYDYVFTNWLFMYLSDEELKEASCKLLGAIKEGGYFFMRESCNRQSGDAQRTFNPSHYRAEKDYRDIFGHVVVHGKRFEIVRMGNIQAYVDLKDNHDQLYWLWKVVKVVS